MSPISAHPIAFAAWLLLVAAGMWILRFFVKIHRNDPTVWAGEMRRFDKADRRDGVPSNVIVFTGSSSPLPVLNRGFGGSQIDDFCEKILATAPSTPIYFISIKPPKRRIAEWPRMQVANRLIRDYCASDERLRYIDIVPPMSDAQATPDATSTSGTAST